MKTALEGLDVEVLEVDQVRVLHQLDGGGDFVEVELEDIEGVDQKPAEVEKEFAVGSADDFQVVVGELEGRVFELDSAGSELQVEPEVDVDQVPFRVDQNVLVVTVFELEQVRNQRVARQRLGELLLSHQEVVLEHHAEDLAEGLVAG